MRAKLNSLPDLIVDAVDAVDLALEEKTRDRLMIAHDKLQTAATAYEEVFGAAEPEEKGQIEQRFSRRITDLKRQIARLPRGAAGRDAELAQDAGLPFLLQRAPGKSIQGVAGVVPRGQPPRYT